MAASHRARDSNDDETMTNNVNKEKDQEITYNCSRHPMKPFTIILALF
jgi:hypothetical protein